VPAVGTDRIHSECPVNGAKRCGKDMLCSYASRSRKLDRVSFLVRGSTAYCKLCDASRKAGSGSPRWSPPLLICFHFLASSALLETFFSVNVDGVDTCPFEAFGPIWVLFPWSLEVAIRCIGQGVKDALALSF
jgi:hypothetical protein